MALQYSFVAGMPDLLEWFYKLQEISHGRRAQQEGWKLSVGNGAQDLIYKVTLWSDEVDFRTYGLTWLFV